MRTETFENVNLTCESKEGLLEKVEYKGTLSKDADNFKFVLTTDKRKQYNRNKIMSDLGGNTKCFKLPEDMFRIQIYVSSCDLNAKRVNALTKVLIKETKDEIARENSKQ